MKRYITILFALLPSMLVAQVEYTSQSISYNKQNVDISFDIKSGDKTLKNNLKMVLTPFLHNGADTLWFDSFEIFGTTKLKRERQEQALNGNKRWQPSAKQILEGESLSFATSTPYQKWMDGATLSVNRRVEGCGCDCYDGVVNLAESLKLYNPPTSTLAIITPSTTHYQVVNPHKQYKFDAEEMKVIFPVSMTKLYSDRYDNQEVLAKIIDAIKDLELNSEQLLNAIEIMGFASPEGTVKFNTQLGEGRATALRDYIKSQLPHLNDSHFYIINGAENWGGLRNAVAASDMKEKEQVLNIIDNKSGDERKWALKGINGGKSYRYMLDNLYPKLRNACYITVYFDELADVAADDINSANALLQSGNPQAALEILLQHQTDSRAWNSIGACMMHLERTDEAIYWLERAVEAGYNEARENLNYLK